MKDSDHNASNPLVGTSTPKIGDIINARLTWRAVLGGMVSTAGLFATGFSVSAQGVTSPFSFPEIARGKGESHLVPDGYAADVLLNSCHSVLMGRFLRASGNVTLYHYPKR